MIQRRRRKHLNCGRLFRPSRAKYAASDTHRSRPAARPPARRAGCETPITIPDCSHENALTKSYNFKLAKLVQFHAVASICWMSVGRAGWLRDPVPQRRPAFRWQVLQLAPGGRRIWWSARGAPQFFSPFLSGPATMRMRRPLPPASHPSAVRRTSGSRTGPFMHAAMRPTTPRGGRSVRGP